MSKITDAANEVLNAREVYQKEMLWKNSNYYAIVNCKESLIETMTTHSEYLAKSCLVMHAALEKITSSMTLSEGTKVKSFTQEDFINVFETAYDALKKVEDLSK